MKTLMRHSMPSHLGYIGPGLGGGIIAVVLGLLLSILLAIVAVFWYPIKRVLGLGSKKKETKEAEE